MYMYMYTCDKTSVLCCFPQEKMKGCFMGGLIRIVLPVSDTSMEGLHDPHALCTCTLYAGKKIGLIVIFPLQATCISVYVNTLPFLTLAVM